MPLELILIVAVLLIVDVVLKALKQANPKQTSNIFSLEFEKKLSAKQSAIYPCQNRANLLAPNE